MQLAMKNPDCLVQPGFFDVLGGELILNVIKLFAG
jgi:hypothetical protein